MLLVMFQHLVLMTIVVSPLKIFIRRVRYYLHQILIFFVRKHIKIVLLRTPLGKIEHALPPNARSAPPPRFVSIAASLLFVLGGITEGMGCSVFAVDLRGTETTSRPLYGCQKYQTIPEKKKIAPIMASVQKQPHVPPLPVPSCTNTHPAAAKMTAPSSMRAIGLLFTSMARHPLGKPVQALSFMSRSSIARLTPVG